MIIDAQHLFSDAQAMTASAASTNLIDLGGDHNVGIGEPMAVVLVLDAAADDTDADETYVVTIEADDNASFSSAATIATRTVARGAAAGSKYVIPVPMDTSAERYMRVYYTLGGTTPGVTATAFLTAANMIDNDVKYADAITIS